MKIKTLWRTMATALASIAILAAFSSCQYDDTEIRNGIDDLNGRVEALEAFQEEIQAEIDALNDIVNNMQASTLPLATGRSPLTEASHGKTPACLPAAEPGIR